MTPDVVVDVGNTRVKWGRVVPGGIGDVAAFPHDDAVGWKRQLELWKMTGPLAWAVSGVNPKQIARFTEWATARGGRVEEVTTETFLNDAAAVGLVVKVRQPERVGVDRLLSAAAARAATPPETTVAVVNVGTAMTVDFVESYWFLGGAILPGPALMARSLHEHTAKLPRVKIDATVPLLIWGRDTTEAIELGIASAILGAADQLIWDWAARCKRPPRVFVTGGDAGYFRGFAFTADVDAVVHDRSLTLDGVRIAAGALP